MTDKLLVVPAWWFSPRALEAIPANLAALDELRRRCEVVMFAWPCVRGGAAVGTDWREIVDALVARTDRRTHLLAVGVPAVGLMAASRGAPCSFINCGVYWPAATLRAVGQHDFADYTERPFPARSYFFVRQVLRGASERKVHEVATIIDAEVDWELARQVFESYHSIDLLAERAVVSAPALYLATPAEELNPGGIQGFIRMAPNTQVRQLRRWPDRMDEEESGRELAAHVLDFLSQLEELSSDAGPE
jgi:hypothetical protein